MLPRGQRRPAPRAQFLATTSEVFYSAGANLIKITKPHRSANRSPRRHGDDNRCQKLSETSGLQHQNPATRSALAEANRATPKTTTVHRKVHQQCGSAASVTSGGNYITTSDSPIPQWRVTDSSSFLSNRPNSTPGDKVSEMARRDTLTNTTALVSTLSTTNIDEYSRTPRAQLASDSETKKEALQ